MGHGTAVEQRIYNVIDRNSGIALLETTDQAKAYAFWDECLYNRGWDVMVRDQHGQPA